MLDRIAEALTRPVHAARPRPAGPGQHRAGRGVAGAPARRSCCAAPTWPCTRPRSAARAGTPSTTPSSSSTRRPTPSSAPSCAGPSTAASSPWSTSRSCALPDGALDRRGDAGALAAPGARLRRPGRVHPDRRAHRPDRAAGRLDPADRAAPGGRSGRPRTARRTRARSASTCRPASCASRASPRTSATALADDRLRPGAADGRGHRDRGVRRRGRPGHPAGAGRRWASRWRWTTSAPATRRWACCGPARRTP